jgi:hypothetical protein
MNMCMLSRCIAAKHPLFCAVQVANFDMVVEEEAPPPPPEQQQQEGDAAKAAGGAAEDLSYDPAATELHKSQQAFWAAILGARPADEAAAAAADDAAAAAALGLDGLGKRRARNAARYIFFDSETETETGSEAEADEGDDEQGQQDGSQQGEGGGLGGSSRRRRGCPRKKRADDDDVEYEAAVDEQEVCVWGGGLRVEGSGVRGLLLLLALGGMAAVAQLQQFKSKAKQRCR